MLQISRFTVENQTDGCVTDQSAPVFAFSLESDRQNVTLREARLSLGDWETVTTKQVGIAYDGPALKAFCRYTATVVAIDDAGQQAQAELVFHTGRMGTPWQAQWITDGSYSFREKRVSPVPMTFRKMLQFAKKIRSAQLYATAMGIYELTIDGNKVGDRYFAPGFTSYKNRLQYQREVLWASS